MEGKITYSTEELEIASSNLKKSLNILQNDIEKSINEDFKVLEDLGLFSSGLNKIKTQTKNLSEVHDTLIKKLENHDSGYQEQQKSFINLIEQARSGEKLNYDNNYSGEIVKARDNENYQKEDGSKIKNSYLQQIVPLLASDSKKAMLKNILTYNKASLTSLFSDSSKANILVYEIKQMLKDSDAKQSEISFDEEKNIQKQVIETIAKEGDNLFMDVNEKTFLSGINYYKRVALANNMTVSDLLINKNSEELLRKSFQDLYYTKSNLQGISDKEISRVKEYFDLIAKSKNISTEELLSNIKYMSDIKGGIKSEI